MKNRRMISELVILDVNIRLKIPDIFTLKIQEKLLVVMGELDIGPRPDTLPPKVEMIGVMVQGVELGLKISDTIPCSMLDKVLTVMGEVDIGLRPEFIPFIINVILVDYQVFIVMVMT